MAEQVKSKQEEVADYKDPARLKRFLTERGKILPRQIGRAHV